MNEPRTEMSSVSVTQHILLCSRQSQMRHHAAVSHSTERAQTLAVSGVDPGHSEVAEVALGEEQILPPQSGAVWVEKHLNQQIKSNFIIIWM